MAALHRPERPNAPQNAKGLRWRQNTGAPQVATRGLDEAERLLGSWMFVIQKNYL